jgi:hypothetical protein
LIFHYWVKPLRRNKVRNVHTACQFNSYSARPLTLILRNHGNLDGLEITAGHFSAQKQLLFVM